MRRLRVGARPDRLLRTGGGGRRRHLFVLPGAGRLLRARNGFRMRDGLLPPVVLHPLPNSARVCGRCPRSATIV
jgi:hypothetical protein